MDSRIPNKGEEVAAYLKITTDSLKKTDTPTTAKRFGWNDVEATGWSDRCDTFLDADTGLWTLHQNPLTRTGPVNEQVVGFIKELHVFGNPLLDRAAVSPMATSEDATTFNFKRGRSAPSRPTAPIKNILHGTYKALGGGKVEGRMHSGEDTGRCHLNKDEHSDGVEISYTIGETEMINPDALGTTHRTFTTAIIMESMGVENKGKAVWITQRSIIFAHPELAGPWAEPVKFYLL